MNEFPDFVSTTLSGRHLSVSWTMVTLTAKHMTSVARGACHCWKAKGHCRLRKCTAFSKVFYCTWQEVVAVGIVMKAGCGRVGLAQLQQHVAATLHPSKWPQAIVYLDRYEPLSSAEIHDAMTRLETKPNTKLNTKLNAMMLKESATQSLQDVLGVAQ